MDSSGSLKKVMKKSTSVPCAVSLLVSAVSLAPLNCNPILESLNSILKLKPFKMRLNHSCTSKVKEMQNLNHTNKRVVPSCKELVYACTCCKCQLLECLG